MPGTSYFTVTFSEPVTPGTVTAATFQALSSPGLTVGAPVLLTPTTFRVPVTGGTFKVGDVVRLVQNPAPGAQVGISAITTPAGVGVALGR